MGAMSAEYLRIYQEIRIPVPRAFSCYLCVSTELSQNCVLPDMKSFIRG